MVGPAAQAQETFDQDQLEREAMFRTNEMFLSNCLTHVIFVQNEQQADVGPDAVRQKLTAALRNLTTRAIIFANGRDALIEPGVEGMVLNAATGGTPVVTVQTCYVGVTGKIVSTHEPRVLTLAHLQHPST